MYSYFALFPFVVFIAVFLGSGIILNDFYAVPAPIAALCGVVSAFFVPRVNFKDKIGYFLKGCGDANILTMCIIFLLAGAFAMVSKSVGSVDAVVYFGVRYLSPEYIPMGVFIISSFLSFSAGTSVGTIVALSPIVFGLSQTMELNINLIGASLLCGAMFGDNLSFISDTTISATQTMNCQMKDKFKANIKIAFPASILSALFFLCLGTENTSQMTSMTQINEFSWVLILPYIIVIFLSSFGVNVFLVLLLGILFSGLIGMLGGTLTGLTFSKKIYEGFTQMNDIFLLALLTGGLAGMVEHLGGIRFLLEKVSSIIKNKISAYLSIGLLVSLCNIAIANNTIAIVLTGKVAKNITNEYGLSPRLSASILDIFSCIAQGLIPYGAQILILIELSGNKIDYFSMLHYVWYIYFLLIFAIISIVWQKCKRII